MKLAKIVTLCILLGACSTLKTSSEYLARGNGYMKDGKRQQALAAYNKALALNPDNLDVYAARGAVHYFNGQYTLAVQDFERVLQQDPYRSDIYTAYASVLAAQGDFQNALKVLNVAQQLRPEQAETYFARAGVHYMLEQYDLAVADYTRTLQLRPAADVFNARGEAYLKWGNPDLAQQDFQTAKEAHIPAHLNDYANLN